MTPLPSPHAEWSFEDKLRARTLLAACRGFFLGLREVSKGEASREIIDAQLEELTEAIGESHSGLSF